MESYEIDLDGKTHQVRVLSISRPQFPVPTLDRFENGTVPPRSCVMVVGLPARPTRFDIPPQLQQLAGDEKMTKK